MEGRERQALYPPGSLLLGVCLAAVPERQGGPAALRRPVETIEHAAEVVRRSEDPSTRNYLPMRVANARLEWAMALADQGDEDEAFAMARLALDRQWFRPDTERRTRSCSDGCEIRGYALTSAASLTSAFVGRPPPVFRRGDGFPAWN